MHIYYCILIYTSLHIYENVMSVCLYECPIITHEPLDQFPLQFDLSTQLNHGNVLLDLKILS